MILSNEARAKVRAAAAALDHLPDNEFIYIADGTLQFHASSQAELKRLRAFFPGVVWSKRWEQWCATWFYRGTYNGADVVISCAEAPPACQRIETKKLVKKTVPIVFEEQEVEETVVTWNCGGNNDEAST